MTDELKMMKKEAIQQHYEQLAQYRDQYGAGKLQNLLDKEGHKFQSFYRKHSDPYALSGDDLWLPPSAKKNLRLGRKYGMEIPVAAGERFTEKDGKLYSNNFGRSLPGVGYNTEVKTDEEGRHYTEGLNPMTALLSNLFGSGNVDVTRNYYADEDNPDEWFWWAK